MSGRSEALKIARQYLLMIKLAKLRANINPISQEDLLREMRLPRSTLSRWLHEAAAGGLIAFVRRGRSSMITLTGEGLAVIEDLLSDLSQAVKNFRIKSIVGKVFSGMGEGAYYLSREGYAAPIEELLGYRPYPGTLNLKIISQDDVRSIILWRKAVSPVIIPGFESEGRTFGEILVYPVEVPGVDAVHAVLPVRRHYGDDVLELISNVNLRGRLGLRDGSLLTVRLTPWSNSLQGRRVVGRGGLEPPTSASSRRRHGR